MSVSGRLVTLALAGLAGFGLFAASADIEVYTVTVPVNQSEVIKLPRRAFRVAVTQPKIAEAIVVAPDQILVHGRSVGTTSLIVWLEPEK